MLCILTMMSMLTVNFSMVEAEEASEIDFSSCRLLVGTNDSTIFADSDNILSAYNGVYLLKYSSAEETKLAYNDLLSKADFVNVDSSSFAVADDSIQNIESQVMSEDLNPISELAEADTTETKGTDVIAVIDTGSKENPNVIERVSMLGDNVTDDNGHGSDMISNIVSQNPNAQIISIKAMDANGVGTVSSIYAALQYAIEKKVSYINMSFVGLLNEETSSIKELIETAINQGIAVVGAAGNNGTDASYFIPGCVEDAYIIGAANSDGTRLENSNYGDNVDYNVVATSTSEACALFTGYLSKHIAIDDVNSNSLIYSTDYEGKVEDSTEPVTEPVTQPTTEPLTKPSTTQPSTEPTTQPSKGSESASDVKSLPVDTSKKVVVKYLFVDSSELSGSETIDKVMLTNINPLLYQLEEYTPVYKAKDGTYKVIVNAPFNNGTSSSKALDVDFANGNADGEVVSEGVSYDYDTNVVTISEGNMSISEGDYANMQVQVMLATSLDTLSKINVTVETEEGKLLDKRTISDKPFNGLALDLDTSTSLSKNDLTVYVNDVKFDDFTVEDNIFNVVKYFGLVSDLRIVVNKKVTSEFRVSSKDSLGNVVDGDSYDKDNLYLADGTDVSWLKKGATTKVGVKIGHSGYYDGPGGFPVDDDPIYGKDNIGVGGQGSYIAQLGIATSMSFGKHKLNFQLHNKSGKYHGKWENKEPGHGDYNHALPGNCWHINKGWSDSGQYRSANVKVLDKNTKNGVTTLVFRIVTENGMAGGGAGFSQGVGIIVTIRVRDSKIKLQMQKDSSVDRFNSAYNREGAIYNIYTDKACTKPFKFGGKNAYITIDSNGYGKLGEGSGVNNDPKDKDNRFWGRNSGADIKKGTYYAKEVTAPSSGKYTCGSDFQKEGYYKFVSVGKKDSNNTPIYRAHYFNKSNKDVGTPIDDPLINLQLNKISADPKLTNGNICYSYKGAVYGIYWKKSDAQNDKNRRGKITTDKDGYGAYLSEGSDGYGTNSKDTSPVYKGKNSGTPVRAVKSKDKNVFTGWYVKELTAPKGYTVDKTVYQLKDSGKVTSKGLKIYRPNGNSKGVADVPRSDPVTVSIKKTDPITGEQIRLPNAVFKLEYYNSHLDERKYKRDFELDTSKSGYTNPFGSSSPTRTWYIKTDSDGYAALFDDFIITNGIYINGIYKPYKSDEVYRDERDNSIVVPYGTLVISEVESPDPDKYKVSTINYYRKVDEEGILSAVRLNFEIPEPRVPSLDTVAVDNSTRSHKALVSANSSITDKITYVGLNPGETYTMKGYVVKKSDPQHPYSDVLSKSFKVGADGTGSISLIHTFASDGSNGKGTLAGNSVVAFAQVVDSKGKVICKHMDVNDSDQTVSYLDDGVITTKASFDIFEDLAVSNYHPAKLGVGADCILDTVYGKGFGANKSYNLYTMVFKVNNGVIGDPICIETMNGPTPFQKSTVKTKADGSFEYTVEYNIDSSKIGNESYVAYEFLSVDDYSGILNGFKGATGWNTKGMYEFFMSRKDELKSYHADPEDADQTINFVIPEITSNAGVMGDKNRKQAYISGNKRDTTIVETLKLSKLNKGVEYAIAPYVYVVENGKRVPLPTDIAEKVKVYLNNELISKNVEGGTFKLGHADAMYKDVHDGIFSFTSVSATQTLSLKFDFSACEDYIKGKTITFGEELGYYNGEFCTSFAEHNTDIASVNNPIETNQTIDFIEATVTTSAISTDTDTHYAYALGDSIDIVDTVSMTGLIPGENYSVVGWLVDKSTNTEIPNTRVTKTITASYESQSVGIPLSLSNPSKYSDVVVFEELYYVDNSILATHKDITNKNQTITFLNPTIDTIASVSGTSEVHSDSYHGTDSVNVYDTVSLTGLIVGKQYTLEGQLINKRESSEGYLEPVELTKVKCTGTNTSLSSDNKTASVVFTATAESQNLVIRYTVNAGKSSVSYVAVEDLLYRDNVIASHNDYDDDDQTVEIKGVGSLVVDKLDSFTGNKLGGVKFNLYSVDEKGVETLLEKQFLVQNNYSTGLYYYVGTSLNSGYTDLSTKVLKDMGTTTPADQVGILTVEDLPEGKYKLVETKTLAGYDIDIKEGILFNVVGGDTTELEVTNSPIFTSINLIKTDDNKDPAKAKTLKGAGFTLYTDKKCTKVARDFYDSVYPEVVTDESGVISFSQLKYDTSKGSVYYLKETTTPKGYAPLDYIIKVVVGKDGKVTYYAVYPDKEILITDTIRIYVEETHTYYTDVTRIINKRGSVTLEKQDENGKFIKGSVWNLYRVDGTTNKLVVLDSVEKGIYRCSDSTKGVSTLVTDDTGNLNIKNLPLGDYYLVEVSSPDGHMPYGDKIEFSLTADKPDLVGSNKIVVKDNVKLLPKTGGWGNMIMFLSIPCLTIALIALALYKRKAKSVRDIY